MTDERWQETLDQLSERFSVLSRATEPAEDGHGTTERVVFSGPLGKLRLSRTVHDRVVGERATGSHRIGSDVAIEKVYDSGDHVSFLTLEREGASGEWEELDPAKLGVS